MQAKPATSSSIAQVDNVTFLVAPWQPQVARHVTPQRTPKKSYEPPRKKKPRKRQSREQRLAAYRRADARALLVPSVAECLDLFRFLFDPRPGISTKTTSRKNAEWFWNAKGWLTPARLLRHLSCKEWVAVTWGRYANARVIDADYHTPFGTEPTALDQLAALERLWYVVRQLHMSRYGRFLPPLKDGKIPDGVHIDGLILTSPRGFHYIEVLKRKGPHQKYLKDADTMAEFMDVYGIETGPGKLEVFPSSNNQSRLPFGQGCTFFYPAHNPQSLQEVVTIVQRLPRVERTFADVEDIKKLTNKLVDTSYEGEGVSDVVVTSAVDPDAELDSIATEYERLRAEHDDLYFAMEHAVLQPRAKKVNKYRALHIAARRDLRAMGSGVRDFIGACSMRDENIPKRSAEERLVGDTTKGSEWVRRVGAALREGSARGERNKTTWNVIFLLRLTFGWSRESVEAKMAEWIYDLSHGSADLSTRVGVRAEHRRIKKLLDRIDVGLENGKYYQAGRSGKMGPPLLLHGIDIEVQARWMRRGRVFLGNLLDGMPVWIQNTMPSLVGAILEQQRDGQLIMSARTLQTFANTPQSKVDPYTGESHSAYKILMSLLERWGVVIGVSVVADRGKRKATIFSVNSDKKEHDDGANNKDESVESAAEDRTSGEETTQSIAIVREDVDGREIGECYWVLVRQDPDKRLPTTTERVGNIQELHNPRELYGPS